MAFMCISFSVSLSTLFFSLRAAIVLYTDEQKFLHTNNIAMYINNLLSKHNKINSTTNILQVLGWSFRQQLN